jgi:DNA invertase Pin-like site-specific DNA recombinase
MPSTLETPHGVPDTPAVRDALADPSTLVRAARDGDQGWSEPYGGPEGVAALTSAIRDHLTAQAQEMTSLRAVAVGELLRDRSLSAVGKALGISKQAVHKINNEAAKGSSKFTRLLAEGLW